MTNISHQVTDDLLMAYAAGNLPEAFSLIVATHISMSDDVRARLGSFEGIGGAVLENCDATPMAEGSFANVLERINSSDTAEPIRVPAEVAARVPAPLRDYIGDDFELVKWRSLGGGVKHKVLKTGGKATARLLRIPGGTAMPDHGHHGLEATLVLQGAFSDEDGRYGPGDIEIADQNLDHTPVAEQGEDCICLAVTDAPLKFNSWIPRIAQPFLGI